MGTRDVYRYNPCRKIFVGWGCERNRGWPSARWCTSPNSSQQILMRRSVPRLGWPRGASGPPRRLRGTAQVQLDADRKNEMHQSIVQYTLTFPVRGDVACCLPSPGGP